MSRPSAEPLLRWVRQSGEHAMVAVGDVLLETQPELRAAKPDARAALSEALGAHVTMLDGFLAKGRPPERLGAAAEHWARSLAESGVRLSSLVHAYELGHAEVWRQFACSLRAAPRTRATALEQGTSQLFRYMQSVTSLAIAAYSNTHERRARREGYRRTELVEGLLDGSVDEALFERVLGYRLGRPHVAYVVWAESFVSGAALDDAIDALCTHIRPLQHVNARTAERVTHGFFSAPAPWSRAAKTIAWPRGVHLACGGSHAGGAGFRLSHREALEARRVAEQLPAVPSFVSYDDVAALALASRDSELAAGFVQRELGALADDGPLLATLEALLRELGSATHAARALGVHPNTVVKRALRIERVLGRPIDPSSLSLRLALSLLPLVQRARPH